MDSDIEEEIIQKHNQAEIFISLFFGAVDIIGYMIIIFQFGCGLKKACHIQKFYFVIILDVALRIINLQITSFIYSFYKEILMSVISTIQFTLMIYIINAIFEDKKNQNFSAGDMGIRDKPLLVCCFFFCSIIFVFSKIFSLVQYIGSLFAVCGFGYYMYNKTNLFLEGIAKKNKVFNSRYFVLNLVIFIGLYFFLHYGIKLVSLFIENPLQISYIQMAYDVFKEIGKYLAFTFVYFIYYLYNKYIYVEDFDFQNDSQAQSSGVF